MFELELDHYTDEHGTFGIVVTYEVNNGDIRNVVIFHYDKEGEEMCEIHDPNLIDYDLSEDDLWEHYMELSQ